MRGVRRLVYEEKRLKQAKMAESVGSTNQHINAILKGRRNAGASLQDRISQALGFSHDDIRKIGAAGYAAPAACASEISGGVVQQGINNGTVAGVVNSCSSSKTNSAENLQGEKGISTGIWISTEFFDHPKTQKLIRRLGYEGLFALQALWLWCAKNRPDGNLTGMDAEDIALAARWKGDVEGQNEADFLCTLVALHWIDETRGGYVLHDWHEHKLKE